MHAAHAADYQHLIISREGNPKHNNNNNNNKLKNIIIIITGHTPTSWKVWKGPILKAVGNAAPAHRLLPHQRHHLSDVDGRALAAALRHDQGAVVGLHAPHAQFAGFVADFRQAAGNLCGWNVFDGHLPLAGLQYVRADYGAFFVFFLFSSCLVSVIMKDHTQGLHTSDTHIHMHHTLFSRVCAMDEPGCGCSFPVAESARNWSQSSYLHVGHGCIDKYRTDLQRACIMPCVCHVHARTLPQHGHRTGMPKCVHPHAFTRQAAAGAWPC